jgi:AraC-like DNA-binding protein
MYQEMRADAVLRQFVDCAWMLTPDPGGVEEARVLPDGHTDLVLAIGTSVKILGPACAVRLLPKTRGFVGLRFRLGAATPLIGIAIDELLDRSVPLSALWGISGHEIENEALAETHSKAAIAVLERALAARIANSQSLDRAVLNAVQRLRYVPNTPVRKLAADIGLSERQLLRRFEWQTGLSIRRLGRILRFQHLVDGLRDMRRRGLARRDRAALAQDYGYADQAHLIRETRALAGVTPTELLQSG